MPTSLLFGLLVIGCVLVVLLAMFCLAERCEPSESDERRLMESIRQKDAERELDAVAEKIQARERASLSQFFN